MLWLQPTEKGEAARNKVQKNVGAGSLGHVKECGLYSKSNGKLLQDFKKLTGMIKSHFPKITLQERMYEKVTGESS